MLTLKQEGFANYRLFQGVNRCLRPIAKLNYAWIYNGLLSAMMANTVSRYQS